MTTPQEKLLQKAGKVERELSLFVMFIIVVPAITLVVGLFGVPAEICALSNLIFFAMYGVVMAITIAEGWLGTAKRSPNQ